MDITYGGSLPQELIAQTERLSPNRRKEVNDALIYNVDLEFEKLLRNLDGDPEAIAVLLDPEVRERVLLETAGQGYRVPEAPVSQKTGKIGQSQLVPDSPINYGGAEQALLDLYSLQRELDYEQTGETVKRDRNNAVYEILRRGVESQGAGGTMSTARGGISGIGHKQYGTRNKHPQLPELSYETAVDSTVNQLIDNLLGNERGEQPTGMVNKVGFMQSIPVEHKLAFNQYPHLGYDSNNRMLGSTIKNSTVRDEENPIRRQVLLMSKIAEKEQDIVDKYGKTATNLANEMNYPYESLGDNRMAGDAAPFIQRLLKDRSGTSTSSRNESPGNNRDRALNIYSEGGDVTIGEGVLRSNGNGNGNGHSKSKMPRRRG